MKTKGIVSAVKQREKGYSIKVGPDWYGGFGKLPCKQDDEVEFEFEESGDWKNISEIDVVKSAPETPDKSNVDARLRRITDCVIGANTTLRGGQIKKEDVVPYAQSLFKAVQVISDADLSVEKK